MADVQVIQVVHEYDDDGEAVREALYAVSEDNAYEWKLAGATEFTAPYLNGKPSFVLNGSNLRVVDVNGINGLRKLLDAIEAVYNEPAKEGK